MSNLQNIFSTEKEALTAESYDFLMHMEVFCNGSEYDQTTVRWSVPKQRVTDNKWYYPVCPSSDKVYKTEEYSSDWSPEEE